MLTLEHFSSKNCTSFLTFNLSVPAAGYKLKNAIINAMYIDH